MPRSLDRYRQKRDPTRTPEPFDSLGDAAPGGARQFVVQQHAARRLHWDLRLEIGGVLVSWAVPRGPSTDPKEKRLAVQTEDHPLEYAGFEGVIPAGNYGAGAMIVWDRGAYETIDGADPAEGLEGGKLDLVFHGYKLRGRWALVRTKGTAGKEWLLLKKADAHAAAAPELVVAQPASILSGLTVEELRDGVRRTADLVQKARAAGAPVRRLDAGALEPMMAQAAEVPFTREGWVFELKHDGWRALANGAGRLYSRNRRDISANFPEVADAVARLPADDFILDGEIVALDENGVSVFERLQQRIRARDTLAVARAAVEAPVVYYCFDLLAIGGLDLRGLPLTTRKELLRLLLPPRGIARYADHIERDGKAFFDVVKERGLEGIVAKRAASTYQCGRRSNDWLKIKTTRSADLAVVGYSPGKGSRQKLGSLLVAGRANGGLVYAGNVGSGLKDAHIAALRTQLDATRRDRPACEGVPAEVARTAVFAEPSLVAEVQYREVTSAGVLRHPVFLRLRDDKRVEECDVIAPDHALDESLPAPEPAAPTLRLSNLDKVFWPADGYTKGDLLRYYETVWPAISLYLRDRPIVLTRYPDGIDGKSFFQKNAPDFTPEWVPTCRIEDTDYFICNERDALLYVINLGCIPIHVWSARRQSLDRPDWTILDLDPKGAPFTHVVEVARFLHRLLDSLEVPHFVKTSGQDGLHVLIPLGATLSHHEARSFAEVLARLAAAELSGIATVARPLGERGGKVYVDFLQNGYGKTIAGPFSVRPRPGAPVSMPLDWREITPRLDPGRFNITTVPTRLGRKADPMRAVFETKADVLAALSALAERVKGDV